MDRDVDVDIDIDRRRHVGGVVAGAMVAGAVIASLPPDCATIYVNGVRYYDCSDVYYVETYEGSEVVYQAVDAPQQ